MLMFPITTLNWTVKTWSYAATVSGGKYLDGAAYYSSLGLAMDLFWFFVVLASWRVLTREYWRTVVVPADPHTWAWFGRFLPERGLVALYQATFFYGVCRMLSWSIWAHVVANPVIDGVRHSGYPYDFSWTGPWWIQARSLPHVWPWLVPLFVAALLSAVYYAANKLWEPMGRAELAERMRKS
jgi:hypothetical protein